MKNENLFKLVEEFVRRLRAYEAKYGKDDFGDTVSRFTQLK